MKRTYRSKKEVGGGLDRRDVLLTVDEKQSVFDAFYIQNIKQTKRELSCMAHSGISSNKVRKKKYVKRIVKDTEPTLHEYISQVAYLTPDKSLRVNKAPDLFDQLLNSSPVSFTPQKPNKNSVLNTLHLKRENKIKTRRKRLAIAKKYNFSSSDSSDSEKENTTDISNVTQEASDIKAHELLVEKIPKTSPKGIDESISNIVRNISLLAKHRKSNVGSSSMQNEFKNDQTTNNQYLQFVQSPILQKSPLCSTPFNDKIRSKSIYKFSPIPIGKFDESPKFLTIFEENKDNDSTKSYDNEDKSVILCKEKEFTASPVIPVKSFKLSKSKENVTSNSIPLIKDDSSVVNCEIELAKIDYCASEKTGDNIIQKDISLTNTEKSELSLVNSELSSCQITETEPFLGFQNTNSSLILTTSSVQPERIESIIKKSSLSAFEVESTLPEQPFLGFSNVNDNSHQKLNTSREYSTSSQNMTISSDDERESLYDTCDTEDNYSDTGTETENNLKFPIVHIERMRDSSFQRYLEKMHACKSTKSNDNSVEIIEDSETDSFTSVHDDEYVTESNEIISENVESDFEECLDSHYEPTDVTSYDTDSSEFTENNNATCVSFVTTRRRNDGTRNSTLQIFDSTFASPCNDFENTIINIKHDKSDLVNNSINTIYEIDDENVDKNKSNIKGDDKIDFAEELENKRTSYVTTRKSSRVRESKSYEALDDSSVDLKCGIVLEPGKKWERSLSIYRRMTMTDNFESTFFNDEQLHGKGRKYRQSVICTMEMQDKNGSLHNESISSRRSTFVSKPSRSTITIIKEPGNISSISLNATDFEDIKGFLGEDCDDTVIELSKLSIAESDHDITVIEQFHETPSRVTTPRDYVLRRCNQTEVLPFDECYPDTVLKNCHKIGEGVYGEVFLWRARDGHARVMKIVPIAGTVKVNGEPQKDFQEIISEIVIAMELSSLRAPISEIERHFDEGKEVEALDLHAVQNATDIFNEVLAVRCVYGNYPSRLLDLWELYDETKGSENDNPAILPADQQYIVLELANAGQDLESYQFNNAEQAYALFYQLAFGLAVAEEAYEFEHRDLHWGNVLITPTEQKYCTFVLRGRAHRVARRGVAGAVIDYSLSRLRAGSARLYHDLATDDALFLAVGDYQFHVYRLMREKTGNDWQNFEPYTNLLWLHYILDKMITALRYKRTGTKIHKHYISKLKDLKNRILDYGSTVQFVLTDNEY